MKEVTIQNPADHSCRYCPIKAQSFASTPHLKFRAPTLRQQTLLQVAYSTYKKTDNLTADHLPLPKNLMEEIKCIHQEIDRWDEDMSNLYQMTGCRIIFHNHNVKHHFEKLEWTGYRCFLADLHWIPERGVIDRQATANMILQCKVGFDPRHEFLLAAANCLETEVARLWPLLTNETKERWSGNQYCGNGQHSIFLYWVAKSTNQLIKMNQALNEMASRCTFYYDHDFVTFKYFWPMIVESLGGMDSDRMKRLFDHAFHESISCGNRPVTFFVWEQAPPSNRQSMISAARCCGAVNYYYSFHKAVEHGQYDVVQLMWDSVEREQHNRMLLAEHAKSFCKAAEKGYVGIAQLLWNAATFNQRFILLFEQGCLAFRQGCANGHIGIARLLWEDAPVDKRRKMLTVFDCEAVTVACRNGHLKVVQYLWENMGDELKILMDTLMENSMMLSKCICESASMIVSEDPTKVDIDGKEILQYIFSSTVSPFKSQLVNALLFNNAAALKALLKRGITTGQWDEITDLLKTFDQEDREQLRGKMTTEQAYLCGLSSVMSNGARLS